MIEGLYFQNVIVCGVIGAMGQFIRAMIGLYKLLMDDNRDTQKEFNKFRFFLSIVLGACCGVLVSFIFEETLRRNDVLLTIAAGYMGTDFIEGFLKKQAETITK